MLTNLLEDSKLAVFGKSVDFSDGFLNQVEAFVELLSFLKFVKLVNVPSESSKHIFHHISNHFQPLSPPRRPQNQP